MRTTLKTALLAAGLFAATTAFAQAQDTTLGQKVGHTAKKGWKATKRTASKVGNKSAEVAVKGTSAVVDKKYDSKVGPQGQTIYIDKNSYYYYVNSKGRHIYVKESALVAKP